MGKGGKGVRGRGAVLLVPLIVAAGWGAPAATSCDTPPAAPWAPPLAAPCAAPLAAPSAAPSAASFAGMTPGAGPASAGRTRDPRTLRRVEVERTAWLMGTVLAARVAAPDRRAAVDAIEVAFDQVARVEALISTWDSATALSHLNRAPVGRAVSLDPELLSLLVEAERMADATGRAFEPAVGPLVDAWDVRGAGRRPVPAALQEALAAVRAGVALDPISGTATRLHPGAWIDTGGFGKGAGLAAARDALLETDVEGALLDFGGQIMVLGEPSGGGSWLLDVAHPARREQPAARLRIGSGLSVATSGGSERPGHLLDPRTGASLPPWGSVTVVSPDPLVADALATALFVLGPDEGLRWALARRDVGALFLEDAPGGLRASWNPAMEAWLDATDQVTIDSIPSEERYHL